jgi:hypothetical protein
MLKILTRNDWKAKPPIEKRIPPIKEVKTGPVQKVAENVMLPREKAVYLTVHHNLEDVVNSPLPQQLRDHQNLMFEYFIDYPNFRKYIYMGDTPYHFFIDSTGQVAEGRELRFAARSNTEYATPIAQHITVVLEGNFEKIQPTNEQMQSLVTLLHTLATEHDIALKNIGYHKTAAKPGQTTCPGKNLINRFGEVAAALAKLGLK